MNHYMGFAEFHSFEEMLTKCTEKYREHILFKTYGQEWSYINFYQDVLRLLRTFSGLDTTYIQIATKHAYDFATAFFAAILAGKIVDLSDNKAMLSDTQMIDDAFEPIGKDNPCVIVRSSGTTSVSKGVVLSQRNLITELHALIRYKPFPEHEVYYHLLPYSHLFGLLGEFLIPFCTGGTVCFAEDNIQLFRHFSAFQPTYLLAPPAIVDAIAKLLETTDDYTRSTGGRLKKIIAGGAALHENSRKRLASYGIQVYTAYGLTECGPVISLERDGAILHGSVGQILPCCNVKIVDGEILVSGDTVMLGYFHDAKATARVIKDGWLHTGDLGYMDQNQFLFLTGRLSNLIVFENGEKLIPEALERRLDCLPGIMESLVLPKKAASDTSRTLVVIFVYADKESDINLLRSSVAEIANQFLPLALLESIQFVNEPFERNKIGKINRKKYQSHITAYI